MDALMDFMMLALALVAGWLGLVALLLAGWRPLGRRLARPLARPVQAVVNSQAVDSDR